MNCQYCGGPIPRKKDSDDRWRRRLYCSRQCARSAIADTRNANADARLRTIETLLDNGHTSDQVVAEVGLCRKTVLDYCHAHGRSDLAKRMYKHSQPPSQLSAIIHGTDAGYHAHHQRNERPCPRCRRAHATASVVREAVRAAKTGQGPRQITNPNDEDWGQAACTGDADPDAWFPDEGDWQRAAYAKLTCYTQCPLRDACLRIALESDADWARWGIWGGLSPHERARLKAGVG